ncbi:cardiolipin synthase ClsB [Orrella sp. JC864]|uniref:cardiolipin synthase ClsB n=1 Tax=Orrella sp. JC864 TaxID=3120298 RepID=UPI00300BF210
MKRPAARLHWTEDNEVALLENGLALFPALFEAIGQAADSVHLETYIFRLDDVGQALLGCLERACARGVKVRVAIDGYGSAGTARALQARLAAMGAQCRIYRPEPRRAAWLVPNRRRLRRLHRKTAVIDGELAFIGGINVIDDYADESDARRMDAPRFDYAVRVRGPVVSELAHAQALLWVRMNPPGRRPAGWRWLQRLRPPAPPAVPAGRTRAALALRDNLRNRKTIEAAYLHAIGQARREIVIANAYFLPGRSFRKALRQAVLRGVRVRLLLQGMVEYRMQYHATRALYDELLRHGMEVYEYMPSYLHAKVAVVDDWATVGSSNLDPFSLLLAREANLMVRDAGFASQLRASLERAIDTGGRRVLAHDYGRRGWLHRLADAVSHVLLRIAVALTGKGGEY